LGRHEKVKVEVAYNGRTAHEAPYVQVEGRRGRGRLTRAKLHERAPQVAATLQPGVSFRIVDAVPRKPCTVARE
jgi:hypothetical protein